MTDRIIRSVDCVAAVDQLTWHGEPTGAIGCSRRKPVRFKEDFDVALGDGPPVEHEGYGFLFTRGRIAPNVHSNRKRGWKAGSWPVEHAKTHVLSWSGPPYPYVLRLQGRISGDGQGNLAGSESLGVMARWRDPESIEIKEYPHRLVAALCGDVVRLRIATERHSCPGKGDSGGWRRRPGGEGQNLRFVDHKRPDGRDRKQCDIEFEQAGADPRLLRAPF